MTSPEFELAMTRTEYDAAIKSLVVASKLAARYQGERDEALAALGRVEALHHRDGSDPDPDTEWCAECCFGWPCSTIRALTEWNA